MKNKLIKAFLRAMKAAGFTTVHVIAIRNGEGESHSFGKEQVIPQVKELVKEYQNEKVSR